MVRSVLITGGNRGIGLEFVRQFLQDKSSPPDNVIVICRDPTNANDLIELKQKHPKQLHVIELDVTNFEQYKAVVESVEEIVGKENGLNLLINNAGILPEQEELIDITVECMLESYKIHCVAPIFLSKHFLPLLKKASKTYKHKDVMSIDKACIVHISSDWGSFHEREVSECGSLYPYRCSKIALNMAMKNLSIDLKEDEILVTSIHPGWVKTDMGGQDGLLDAETSVKFMMETMSNMTRENHGSFMNYDGTSLPW